MILVVTTSEISPSPELAPFVRCCTNGEFDTFGTDMEGPWHAAHKTIMALFFRDRPIQLADR